MPTRRSESGPGKRKKPAAAKKAAAGKPEAKNRRPSSLSDGRHPDATRSGRKARGGEGAEAGSTPATGATNTVGQLMAARPVRDPDSAEAPLSMSEEAFLSEYLRNNENGTAAWIFAHPGCSPSAAAVQASRTIRKPKVAARIAAARQQLARKFEIDRETLLQRFLAIAEADPNELTQMRHLACGLCWNGNRGPAMYVDPDPDCESCSGEGVAMPWIADTRRLSPAGRALFAGIKQTKDGVQVLMHDKVSALNAIGKIIGAFEEDNKQKQPQLADAVREFFSQLHGRRLPIARAEAAASAAPAHPLVGAK